jgi:hypothetical protein
MATTYEAIATVTVGSGGAANMEFTSIPQTYTDLVIKASTRTNYGTQADACILQFNSNSSSYSMIRLQGSGSAASSNSNTTNIRAVTDEDNATANTFGSWEAYVPNYTLSNNKSVSLDSVMENNATAAEQNLVAGLWSNTAAITSIKLLPLNGTAFKQYSTATLYGIKNS